MDLFKSKGGIVDEHQLTNTFSQLELYGKDVIIYSRLLSLGRFLGKESITRFLEILKEQVGVNGTIVIPTYTLNSYQNPRVFNIKSSKIMSGVLGELANQDLDFKRTIHPVYSNCLYGKNTDYYLDQDATTCFGVGSFFDLFSRNNSSVVLMIGLNFNGPTLYHYYDQKYNAKGRFLKDFHIEMNIDEYRFKMNFNSYVKDYDFYKDKMNCLARFDALLNRYDKVKTLPIGDDYIHQIKEIDFNNFYKAALDVDQDYFLMSSNEIWDEYFMKNNYRKFHNLIDNEKCNQIINNLSKSAI